MKKIDIQINRAEILSYEVSLKDTEVDVSATIGLFAGKNKISTFTLGTKSWDDKNFDLPIQLVEPIREIAQELENILIKECSSALGELESGK